MRFMARPLRIEYAGAIYHVMPRGNAGQAIFKDDVDRQNLFDGLEDTVIRCGWELFSFVFMPNHIHLFFRTPRPNLSRGMQRFLSSDANRYAKRHRCPGHLFQGRFKDELIEDESHFWSVSRSPEPRSRQTAKPSGSLAAIGKNKMARPYNNESARHAS